MIPENIHTSYTTDDFHILTPPPPLAFEISKLHYPPIPSEFHNKIFSSNPSELLTKFSLCQFSTDATYITFKLPQTGTEH